MKSPFSWAVLAVVTNVSLVAHAQSADPPPLQSLRWLSPDSAVSALTETPRPLLSIEAAGGRASVLVKLGELVFRAPRVLGGEARLAGLSCQTCHPNGGAATGFFVDGVSDRPGNVDVTHRLFNALTEDGRANPINIPSLRGIVATAPYGRDGRIGALREFTRQVIVTEFDGREPAGWLLDALVAYQQQLAFLPGPSLGPGGRLRSGAREAVSAGEKIFFRPFPKHPELSCAGCHRPSSNFVDGKLHDVGSGGYFDTPTLRNIAETKPYFHDGRYAELGDVIDHFDLDFELNLGAGEKRQLLAYLDAIGSAQEASVRRRADDDWRRTAAFLDIVAYAANLEDGRIGAFAAEAIRFELGHIYQRFPHAQGKPVRLALAALSQALRAMVRSFEVGKFVAARQQLQDLARSSAQVPARLKAAGDGSLYDPDRLEAAIERR